MNKSRHRQKYISPPRFIILIFILMIFIGTIFLRLPISSTDGESVGWLDALFIATSAVSVNGLVTIDISSTFSTFGQLMIMILIQIGGLGFMTLGVIIAIILGKKIGLRQRLLIQETTQSPTSQGLVKLTLYIFIIALTFEAVATIILTFRWMGELGFGQALYYAVFHSISAFNNAGFSLWSDSLSSYIQDPVVNITIITLFVFGGLGYIVIVEIFQKRSWKKFSVHTKLVLIASGILTIGGFLFLFILESLNTATFGDLSLGERILAAFFQSAAPRSAGFNTLEIGNMLSSSQLLIILLMFIGASSGGTGGGIKTNTVIVLILATLNSFRGGGPIHVFKRRIATETVMRALAVVISSLVCVFVVAFMLTITEGMLEEHFLEVLFEATSAFSTTGMSMGLTSELSPAGKIIVAGTMLIGRLGPLTLAYALAKKARKTKVNYPEDHILIG